MKKKKRKLTTSEQFFAGMMDNAVADTMESMAIKQKKLDNLEKLRKKL